MFRHRRAQQCDVGGFSALQRAEIAEMSLRLRMEPSTFKVSVLFNEPKLLKSNRRPVQPRCVPSFSALQRAEIAEILARQRKMTKCVGFSALQRAEIAEIFNDVPASAALLSFSALQRAEIAEICVQSRRRTRAHSFQCSSTSRNC